MIRGTKAHVAHAFPADYYKMIDKKIKTFNALINNPLLIIFLTPNCALQRFYFPLDREVNKGQNNIP